MKTVDQIVAQIKAWEPDFFGFRSSDLLKYLPFEAAKPFLKDDATAETWAESGYPHELTFDAVLKVVHDYMEFAWGKANDERGLSAGRSIDHMSAWLWLLGDDALAEAIRDYGMYGKPQLRAICEKFDWDWRKWDNGDWGNTEGGPYVPPEMVPTFEVST